MASFAATLSCRTAFFSRAFTLLETNLSSSCSSISALSTAFHDACTFLFSGLSHADTICCLGAKHVWHLTVGQQVFLLKNSAGSLSFLHLRQVLPTTAVSFVAT